MGVQPRLTRPFYSTRTSKVSFVQLLAKARAALTKEFPVQHTGWAVLIRANEAKSISSPEQSIHPLGITYQDVPETPMMVSGLQVTGFVIHVSPGRSRNVKQKTLTSDESSDRTQDNAEQAEEGAEARGVSLERRWAGFNTRARKRGHQEATYRLDRVAALLVDDVALAEGDGCRVCARNSTGGRKERKREEREEEDCGDASEHVVRDEEICSGELVSCFVDGSRRCEDERLRR